MFFFGGGGDLLFASTLFRKLKGAFFFVNLRRRFAAFLDVRGWVAQ